MSGNIKRRKLICGVGINDAPYSTLLGYTQEGKQIRCPFYIKWKSLIQRCYSETYWKQTNKHGSLKNAQYEFCEVVDEWHRFTNFKSWMEKQDWEGKHLDKDILVPGNTIYGPDTCMFIPPHINTMLVDQKSGKYGKGVWRDKRSNIFRAQIRVNGKRTTRGSFATAEEAEELYSKLRREEIIKEANKLSDIKLKNALINYAKIKYDGV